MLNLYPFFKFTLSIYGYIALEHNGLKIMILLRLSPLIPNHTLDYVSGVTSITLRDYIIALIGILPATIALCYTGATASSVAEGKESATNINSIMLIAGLVFALAGALLASYYAKQELDKLIITDEASELQEPNCQLVDINQSNHHDNRDGFVGTARSKMSPTTTLGSIVV
jgi:SNARE associated Golgi protein